MIVLSAIFTHAPQTKIRSVTVVEEVVSYCVLQSPCGDVLGQVAEPQKPALVCKLMNVALSVI